MAAQSRGAASPPPDQTALHPPEDWTSSPPDFVGVGVQKAGTFWWFALISEHPAVENRALLHKELHFFDRFGDRAFEAPDIERYTSNFRRPLGKLCGEWTPEYCFDPWVMPLLHEAAPNAKVIVALRDPLARFVSGITYDVARGRRRSPSLVHQHLMRSSYVPQLRRIYAYFAPASVLVLQFEQMVADPNRA